LTRVTIIFFFIWVILGACSTELRHSSGARPNIVFILVDDHAYQALGAYGNSLVPTPNIDRIAREGIIFRNASVTNSICAPSRAVILTGKHAHINGKIDNISEFDTTNTTFPMLFREQGYQTAMFGKLHFGNSPKGVDRYMILPDQGSYFNPDFITDQGDTVINGYVTKLITDLSIGWLEEERKEDQPFLLMYWHKAPHRPWWPTADKFREFTQKSYPQPETFFDTYDNRSSAASKAEMNILAHMELNKDQKLRKEILAATPGIDMAKQPIGSGFTDHFDRLTPEQQAPYLPILDSLNQWFMTHWPSMTDKERAIWKHNRFLQDYLACISTLDDEVGRLLDYLDESGLSENTLVVYTSDQGFFLGEHGWFDKRFAYEESLRTPLIMKWPGTIKGGRKSDDMVQNLDLAPTFLDAAGIDIPSDIQGESLLPILQSDTAAFGREVAYYHFYEYPAVHMVKRHYALVGQQYKLIHYYYDVDEWELFDRINDPQEMNNLVHDPTYEEVVVKLKKELVRLRAFYGDSPALDTVFLKQRELL